VYFKRRFRKCLETDEKKPATRAGFQSSETLIILPEQQQQRQRQQPTKQPKRQPKQPKQQRQQQPGLQQRR